MSKLKDELQSRLDAYDRQAWDDDDPNYNKDQRSVSDIFSGLYYGEYEYETEGDDYEYFEHPPIPFTFELPVVGEIRVVDRYDDHEDGHALYVVFEYEGALFQYQGWNDSWGGDGGFEGPLNEVAVKQVVRTEYEVVK